MPDRDQSQVPPYVTREVVIPIRHEVTEVIVARRDETGGSATRGEHYTRPLPPQQQPQQTEGAHAMSGGHDDHAKGSWTDKVWPALAIAVAVIVVLNMFSNWMDGRPLVSNFFGGGGYHSAQGGFNGLAGGPRRGPPANFSPAVMNVQPRVTWHPGPPPAGTAHQCVACRPGYFQDPNTCECSR